MIEVCFCVIMIYNRFHGRTTVILQFSLVLCFCCSNNTCKGKPYRRPEFCELSNLNKPMSFLWTVRRDPPSFLFGTIHVPYSRVWEYIPDNVKKAFEFSENVYFELDLTEPSTISALTNCQLLPKGENLSDVLPKDIYRRLKRHLDYVKNMMPSWMTADQRGRGLYADYLFNAITGNWERKRPVWIMLMVNSLTEGDVKSRGIPVLDLYLAQQAERMNKLTGAVERVEEQCIPLNGLNVSQVLFALNQTLNQHENVRSGNIQILYTTDDLIKHYNCGDLNAVIFNRDTTQVPNFTNHTLHPMDQVLARNIDEYFRDELIYKRNERMAERVMRILVENPAKSYFFAFGAGHFLGNNTILDMMETAGFFVEHIPADRKIKLWKKRPKAPVKVLPEFRALRDFSLASNSLDDKSDEQNNAESNSNSRNKLQKKLLPPRSASSPSSRKHRNFNDLWVRLDPYTTSSSQILPRDVVGEEALIVQQSLRVWYGLPLNQAAVTFSVWFPLFTVVSINILANALFQHLHYSYTLSRTMMESHESWQ